MVAQEWVPAVTTMAMTNTATTMEAAMTTAAVTTEAATTTAAVTMFAAKTPRDGIQRDPK